LAINLKRLTIQIERRISKLHLNYCQVPASILTEDDLKFRLQYYLSRIPALRCPRPTIDRAPSGIPVHAELSWYDEFGPLRIRPDLTIIEPEHIRIGQPLSRPIVNLFSGCAGSPRRTACLPSKEFEFTGNAIAFELKFARRGINEAMARLIRKDFQKIERLFRLLDARGEGNSIFCYLVIFNRFTQPPWKTPLAEFLKEHRQSSRHKIVYKTWHPISAPHWRRVNRDLGTPNDYWQSA
jgi:hypothetical protein